jgi:hypothetical protein
VKLLEPWESLFIFSGALETDGVSLVLGEIGIGWSRSLGESRSADDEGKKYEQTRAHKNASCEAMDNARKRKVPQF